MSYTKQNWQTGDTITAEKLNHMEDGISGGYDIVITSNENGMTADGASPEELASGGYKKAIMNTERMVENTSFLLLNIQNRSVADFGFFLPESGHPIQHIGLLTDGTYQYSLQDIGGEPNPKTGTYTYSNGHYVFTPSESGS